MASSLFALLSQQTPNLKTRKGLILTGLQHDFLSPDGKLPVSDCGFLDNLEQFTTDFRKYGDVIWVRSEFEATRNPDDLDEAGCNVITSSTQAGQKASRRSQDDYPSDAPSSGPTRKRKAGTDSSSGAKPSRDTRQKHRKSTDDEQPAGTDEDEVDAEFFLTQTSTREPCCVKGSVGADYTDRVKSLIRPSDLRVTKSYYSAFSSTSLLLTLRSRLITELYVCGCMTNMSVYATAMDAARYGIKIVLVVDCLGYRQRDRHDLAIQRLTELMEAKVTTSKKAIQELVNPPLVVEDDDESEEDEEESDDEEVDVDEDTSKPRSDGPLEVDSDDEDGEMDLPMVRPSHGTVGAVSLPFRGLERGLPVADEKSGHKPASQHPQPARTPHPKPSTAVVEGASDRRSVDEGRASTQVAASDQAGVTRSMSPKRHKVRAPLPGVLRYQPQGNPTVASHTKHRDLAGLARAFGIDKETVKEYEAAATSKPKVRKWKPESAVERQRSQPLFGVEKKHESCGSTIHYDLLAPDRVDGIFHRLSEEVEWQRMTHMSGEVPRRLCCQGSVANDGSKPVYRHPSDRILPLSGWSPTVDEIRQAAETLAGHELNHALIQLYRGGPDYISEHSDKTLDIVPDSNIVNVSFGAERVMRLRSKRSSNRPKAVEAISPGPTQRTTHRVRLPHNSALVMTLRTNARYLHGINPDKRADSELTPAEKAYNGQRISLTFRQIGTVLSKDEDLLWGLGATGKTREEAGKPLRGDEAESERLLQGFGKENQSSDGTWEQWYGEGSDVLDLR